MQAYVSAHKGSCKPVHQHTKAHASMCISTISAESLLLPHIKGCRCRLRHTYLHTMNKSPAKFQKDRNKIVGGLPSQGTYSNGGCMQTQIAAGIDMGSA